MCGMHGKLIIYTEFPLLIRLTKPQTSLKYPMNEHVGSLIVYFDLYTFRFCLLLFSVHVHTVHLYVYLFIIHKLIVYSHNGYKSKKK